MKNFVVRQADPRMKRVPLSKLLPGMVTSENVYTSNNQLIVPKNTTLTDKLITKLELYDILNVRIDEIETEARKNKGAAAQIVSAKDAQQGELEGESYSEIIKNSPEFIEFQANFDEAISGFKNSMNAILEQGEPINVNEVFHNTIETFDMENNNSFGFFHFLQNMRQYDDLTYAHCLNVSLISNVLAGWLHLSEEDQKLATLCGLFHDIGKLTIPDSITKKPDKLTDEEYKIMKNHTVSGFRLLQNQDVSDHIKNAALMHHEKCDGSGYPMGLKGDQIDKFAKIVAIADVYDAMTAARVYRGPLCPFTVIEIFEKEGLQCYETEYILCFLENVVQTFINNRVKLTNGLIGDIVYINKHQLSKPMVKCGDQFMDLSQEKDVSIECFV
ncbi:MAG: HD-GYP domain-containing protein [Lachnospiraceae bacterium]|nr:HD-GYP domain-containing protein [Lachnospiraceae bacterium]